MGAPTLNTKDARGYASASAGMASAASGAAAVVGNIDPELLALVQRQSSLVCSLLSLRLGGLRRLDSEAMPALKRSSSVGSDLSGDSDYSGGRRRSKKRRIYTHPAGQQMQMPMQNQQQNLRSGSPQKSLEILGMWTM